MGMYYRDIVIAIRTYAYNTFILQCYYRLLVNLITEQTEEAIRVCYYLKPDEFTEFKIQAAYMHTLRVIPRPTVGAFAKAAGFKWYNEINQELKKRIQNGKTS